MTIVIFLSSTRISQRWFATNCCRWCQPIHVMSSGVVSGSIDGHVSKLIDLAKPVPLHLNCRKINNMIAMRSNVRYILIKWNIPIKTTGKDPYNLKAYDAYNNREKPIHAVTQPVRSLWHWLTGNQWNAVQLFTRCARVQQWSAPRGMCDEHAHEHSTCQYA